MQRSSNLKALFKSVILTCLLLAVIGGGVYAALESQQAVLSGNTITSATADLKLSTDGSSYGASMPGFNFNDVIPGGPAVPAAGYSFFLKNSGSISTSLKVSVKGTPTNPNNVDLSKVSVIILRVPGGTAQSFSLSALMAANASGGLALTDNLSANSTLNYKVQISMAADAFSGQGVTLGNIDLVFVGSALLP